jgi:hypothetical protein
MAEDRPVSATSRAAAITASRPQLAARDAFIFTDSAATTAAATASDRDLQCLVVQPQKLERPPSVEAKRGGSAASARFSHSTDSNAGRTGPCESAQLPPPRRRLWERLRGCFCSAQEE